MFKRLTLLFILFLQIFSTIGANTENFYFDQISLKEGLSQSMVKIIFRDHIGMLWIGTKEGLNRYDGYEVKTYYHDPQKKESLPNNNISVIIEDSLNNLWIGSDGAFCRYDRQSNSFTPEKINGKDISLPNAKVVGRTLYSATATAIYTYDCVKKLWTEKTFFGSEKSITMSTKLEEWNDGKLIIGSRWKGIFICNPQTGELSRSSFFKGPNVLDIYQDSKKNLWISEFGNGVVCFDRKGRKLVDFQEQNQVSGINKVMDILEYKNQIWLATDGNGIFVYSPQNKDIYQIKHDQNKPFSLPVNSIMNLYSDKYSDLWIGTIRGGLLGVRNVFIQSYVNAPLGNSSGLSEQTILSFYEDNDCTIWIGTDGEGINSYNPKTMKFKHYPSTFGKKVSAITSISSTYLLISKYNEGIALFNKKNGQIREFPLKSADDRKLSLNNLIGTNLINGGDGNIYICDGNVYVFSISTGKLSLLKNADYGKGAIRIYLNSNFPNHLILYDNTRVSFFDLKKKSFNLHYNVDQALGTINVLEIDRKKRLWLGLSTGLYHWDGSKKQFKKINSNQFKSISCLIASNSGSLWIGSGLELFQYNLEKHELYNYGKSDGVNPNEYLYKSRLLTKSGDVYMGGVSGFVRIDKETRIKKQENPVFELLDIQLDGTLLPSELLKNKNGLKKVQIPWNFTSLAINIFANTADLNTKIQCRYRFEEKETNYHEIDKRTILLQNLSPGNYTLQVEYKLKNEQWSNPVTLIKINVTPPWWQRWWFYLISALIIMGSLFRFRQNAIRKTKQSMEVEMERRERDISEQKVKFMINISHELRTPLTLVYTPLRRLRLDPKIPSDLQPTVNLMYKNVKNMKNMIDMVLDIRKMDVNMDSLNLKTHNLNEWITNLCNDFQFEMEDKKIDLVLDLDDRISEIVFDEQKCAKVLSNLLMNAIKFSDASTHIQIKSTFKNNTVRVSVLDEGIGISPDELKQLFTRFYQGGHEKGGTGIGLSYAKTQVELHGGTMGYEPNNKKGSIFWFEIPINELNLLSSHSVNQILQENAFDNIYEIDPIDLSELKRLTVLIVEDEVDLLNYLKESLTPYFDKVMVASNGEKGLTQVYQNMPDLIISDVMMPEMDGFEMCRKIKTDIEISHIPLILLTALGDEESSIIGYKMGADMYLSKPFGIDHLTTVISSVIKHRNKIKQNLLQSTILPNPKEITFSNADEKFLNKLISLIENKISNSDLMIDNLAIEMAMSRSSFYNKVKLVTGMSANVFLNDYRIKKAIEMLGNKDTPIVEIAMSLGFVSQRYFSTVFKQFTGKTPTQYRSEL